MPKTASAFSVSDVVNDLVIFAGAYPASDVIESKALTDAPCDIMIGARGVPADTEHGLKFSFLLTKNGIDTVCSAHTLVNEIEEAMLKGLPKKEVEKLKAILKLCSNNLSSRDR